MSELIGLWRLNENVGVNAPDISGYGNHGTLEGTAPTWVSGIWGNCVSFPGANERIDCGNGAPLDQIGNGSFWISFWMKSKDAVPLSNSNLFSKYQDANNEIFISSRTTLNQLQFYMRKSGTIALANFNAAPFDTEFNHIVIVVNRITDKIYCYMNSVKDAIEGDLSALPADCSNTGNLSWGAKHDGSNPYEGALDELRIGTGVLSLDDITFLFNHPNGLPGPIGHWRLNEKTGIIAKDDSAYGNNGTLEGNAPTWVKGKSRNCVSFPGANERIDCGNLTPLDEIGRHSFWISFWMKSLDVVPLNWEQLFSKFVDGNNRIGLFSNGIINRLRFGIYKSGISVDTSFSVEATPFDTNWNHIVFIVNRTIDKALCYINNTKDATEVDLSILSADCSNAARLSWGGLHQGSNPYEGLLDEMQVNLGLPTLDDIEYLFNNPGGLPKAPEGLQLKLKSPSDELLGILSDTDLSGQILNAKITEQKIGGVEKFSFQVPRSIDLPITRNTECYFYVNSVLWKIGYVKEIPKPDQDLPILNVEGDGFSKRLLKKVINVTYTDKTLDFIVKTVGNTYLGADIGVFYDVDKITVPAISNITIQFKDKNLFKVFEKLLEIANYDYENAKYRFYVDNEKELVFELLSEDFQTKLFEGYQYQNPEVTIDNAKIINKILVFRTISGTPKEVEYVAAYQDTESQGRFGIFEQKITFPDYIDTITISKICAFILKRKSFPENKIKIENYETLTALLFGKYGIFNRQEKYWRIIADCDTLEGWDSYLVDTNLALSTSHVLTGKRSLKFTTAAGSNGEYVEFILNDIIPLPQKIRIFIYFESVTIEFKVTFYDDHGNELSIEPGSTTATLLSDQWIRFSQDINQETEVDNMEIDPNGVTEDFVVNYDVATEYNLDIRYETQVGLLEVKKVRITMLTDSVAIFYIDRIDVFANIYNFHALQLEEIEYNLSSVGLFANMNFGEKEDSILDEIKSQVKEGNIALEIFSKQ